MKAIHKLKEQLSLLKVDSKDSEFSTYKTRISKLLKMQDDIKEDVKSEEKELNKNKSKKLRTNSNGSKKKSGNKWRSLEDRRTACGQLATISNQHSALSFTQSNKKLQRVTFDQIKWTVVELRLSLRMAKIALGEINEKIFRTLELDEKISIYELVKMLKRKPLSFEGKDIVSLARYLIEAKDKTEIEYNELAEEFASEILRELKSLIGDDFTLWTEDSRSMLKESIEKKVLNNTAKINNKLKSIKKDILSAETIEIGRAHV